MSQGSCCHADKAPSLGVVFVPGRLEKPPPHEAERFSAECLTIAAGGWSSGAASVLWSLERWPGLVQLLPVRFLRFAAAKV